ncbi:Cardioacceleratory peptide receptor, partial [Gryllus bimaculatus]
TEQFAVLWILFTLIVLGNSAVLVALFLNKNRKSRMNFFIMQLALAGIIFIITYYYCYYIYCENYTRKHFISPHSNFHNEGIERMRECNTELRAGAKIEGSGISITLLTQKKSKTCGIQKIPFSELEITHQTLEEWKSERSILLQKNDK